MRFFLFFFLFFINFVRGMDNNLQNCQQLARDLHKLVSQNLKEVNSIDTLKKILSITSEFNDYDKAIQQEIAQYFCLERAGRLLVDTFSKPEQGKFFTDKKNAQELEQIYNYKFRGGQFYHELLSKNYLVIAQKNNIWIFDKTSKKICWTKRLKSNFPIIGIRWQDTGKLLVSTNEEKIYKYDMYGKNYQHFREVLIDELLLYVAYNEADHEVEVLKKLVGLYEFSCLLGNSSNEILRIVERFKAFKKKCVGNLKQVGDFDCFEDGGENFFIFPEELD